jgi:hypothetical protein
VLGEIRAMAGEDAGKGQLLHGAAEVERASQALGRGHPAITLDQDLFNLRGRVRKIRDHGTGMIAPLVS